MDTPPSSMAIVPTQWEATLVEDQMKATILMVILAMSTFSEAGVLKFTAKKVVPTAAKVVVKTAKVAYKVVI